MSFNREVIGLTNCSSCITHGADGRIIARCFQKPYSDGPGLLTCECTRNFGFQGLLNSNAEQGHVQLREIPPGQSCVHAFSGLSWVLYASYLYLVPAIWYAFYAVVVVLRAKVNNVRSRSVLMQNTPPGVCLTLKMCVAGNKVIFALNTLLLYILTRSIPITVNGPQGVFQLWSQGTGELIAEIGNKSSMASLGLVGVSLYEVREKTLQRDTPHKCTAWNWTVVVVGLNSGALAIIGTTTLFYYRKVEGTEIDTTILALRNWFGWYWNSFFGIAYPTFFLYLGSKTIAIIKNMARASTDQSIARKRKIELVVVMSFYLLAAAFCMYCIVGTVVLCDIVGIRYNGPRGLMTCSLIYGTENVLIAFVAARVFEGTVNTNICSCGLGKRRRPSTVLRTFDDVAKETSEVETTDSIRGMLDTAKVFLASTPSTDRPIEYKTANASAQSHHHPKAVI